MSDFKTRIETIFKKLDRFSDIPQTEYINLFVKELQKQNFSIQQDNTLEKYMELLDPKMKDLFKYNITSKDDFIQRLIMFLNIANDSSKTSEFLEKISILANLLLKLLYEIASDQLKEENPLLFIQKNLEDPQKIKELTDAWSDFVKNQEHIKIQKQISSIITGLIQPCVIELTPQIKEITQTLIANPQSITDLSILKTLEKMAEYRDKDCKLLKKNSTEIGKNASEVIVEIETVIRDNDEHIKEVIKIKESITQKKDTIQEEKQSLINTTDVLHKKIVEINSILRNKEDKIKRLYDEINALSVYIKTIEEQSKMDGLTEVYNRKHIENIAEICEKEFQSNAINYSILFFDIDNFKDINDAHGHTAGDKLLSIFSKILKQNCRGTDIVGRYGGDEFLILMPNTDLEKAKEFAKRICKTIEKSNFVFKDKKIKITTSVGMTDRFSHKNKHDMIDCADKFLYKAKKLGRNRVEWE